MYVFRGLGFIVGSVLMKIIDKRLTLHQIISLGAILTGIFSILFNFSTNLYWKGFMTLATAIGLSFKDIAINVAALECFAGDNVSMWLQGLHGWFGIGGLLGPSAVYFF